MGMQCHEGSLRSGCLALSDLQGTGVRSARGGHGSTNELLQCRSIFLAPWQNTGGSAGRWNRKSAIELLPLTLLLHSLRRCRQRRPFPGMQRSPSTVCCPLLGHLFMAASLSSCLKGTSAPNTGSSNTPRFRLCKGRLGLV